jgi:AsmA protein
MEPRQHTWKWLLLGLVAIVLALLAVLPRQLGNSEKLRDRVTEALSEWTGGKVTLNEPWSVRYFPPLSIRGGFTVDDTTRLPLVQSIAAKDIKISLSIPQLLLGRISIDGMRLNQAVITLKERTAPPVTPGEIVNLLAGSTVSALRLRNATIKSADGEDLVTKLYADLDASDGGGALSAFGSFEIRNETIRFVVDNGAFTVTETGLNTPFRLRLSGPITATLNGNASVAGRLQFDGTLQADIGEGRQFLKWTGIEVPDSQSLKGLSISGPAHWSGSTLTVNGGTYTLDGNAAVGLLAITMGERPRIEGTLDFERLVLDPYIGGTQPEAVTAPQGSLLDWVLLKYFDTDLRISAAQIATSSMELGRGGFTVNAKQGVVATEIGELELCGGQATGHLGLDLSKTKIKASLVGSLTDIGLDSCLKPLALTVPLKGVSTIKADVTTEGETADELLSGLTGDLKIKAQNGAVPVDFARLHAAGAPPEEGWSQKNFASFDTLDADCRLSAGHIWCQRFQMQTQRNLVSGAGDVDMRRQTLDWSLSVANIMAAQAETPSKISIRGPLAQPTIRRSDRPTFGEDAVQTGATDAPVSPR